MYNSLHTHTHTHTIYGSWGGITQAGAGSRSRSSRSCSPSSCDGPRPAGPLRKQKRPRPARRRERPDDSDTAVVGGDGRPRSRPGRGPGKCRPDPGLGSGWPPRRPSPARRAPGLGHRDGPHLRPWHCPAAVPVPLAVPGASLGHVSEPRIQVTSRHSDRGSEQARARRRRRRRRRRPGTRMLDSVARRQAGRLRVWPPRLLSAWLRPLSRVSQWPGAAPGRVTRVRHWHGAPSRFRTKRCTQAAAAAVTGCQWHRDSDVCGPPARRRTQGRADAGGL